MIPIFALPNRLLASKIRSPNMAWVLVTTVIAIGLYGCSSLPRQIEQLSGIAPCCVDASQFRFEVLKQGEEIKTSFSESSPVFNFHTGKSYFAAFQLPPSNRAGSNLSVRTFWAATKLEQPQVFCPSVTFYDEDFKPITTELFMLSYHPGATKEGGQWRSMAPVPSEALYAVMHAETRRIGNLLAITTGTVAPPLLLVGPGFAYYQSGGAGQEKYQCGYIGQIILSVSPQ
ncbi:MAG: hypothetical protein ROZ00_06125 [Denitratisoma sp.]|nr:hypothetical protein [Denitratisoma sp.]